MVLLFRRLIRDTESASQSGSYVCLPASSVLFVQPESLCNKGPHISVHSAVTNICRIIFDTAWIITVAVCKRKECWWSLSISAVCLTPQMSFPWTGYVMDYPWVQLISLYRLWLHTASEKCKCTLNIYNASINLKL